MLAEVRKNLKALASQDKAKVLAGFFKTGKGQYGEGDIFMGITVPQVRSVVKTYANDIKRTDLKQLLSSPLHEERLCALLMLVHQFAKTKEEEEKSEITKFYLAHKRYINNWDLVDLSASKILGSYLFDKDRSLLNELAQSKNLWDRRIAVVATYYFIKNEDFKYTLALSKDLLQDEEDLMHKACGWMLREVGKRDQEVLEVFLRKHYHKMPRTMLRYAIEKFPEKKRKAYLLGTI
jgi:3-methyladenine DNA glycosylase AlkD